MHDCPFLVIFDINEDLKFAKIRFLEEGNITATGTYMFCHFGTNICANCKQSCNYLFNCDFCSISLYATVPLLLYCVQGVANIE